MWVRRLSGGALRFTAAGAPSGALGTGRRWPPTAVFRRFGELPAPAGVKSCSSSSPTGRGTASAGGNRVRGADGEARLELAGATGDRRRLRRGPCRGRQRRVDQGVSRRRRLPTGVHEGMASAAVTVVSDGDLATWAPELLADDAGAATPTQPGRRPRGACGTQQSFSLLVPLTGMFHARMGGRAGGGTGKHSHPVDTSRPTATSDSCWRGHGLWRS